MINKVLEKVFENIEHFLIDDVESKYIDEMKQNYMKMLNLKYCEDYKDYDDFDLLFEIILDFEKSSLELLTPNEKKSLYVEDQAFNKIKAISSKAEELAWQRKEKEILVLSNIFDEYGHQLEELLVQVADFNKDVAEILVSESLVDLAYACGRSDNTSLRMGR